MANIMIYFHFFLVALPLLSEHISPNISQYIRTKQKRREKRGGGSCNRGEKELGASTKFSPLTYCATSPVLQPLMMMIMVIMMMITLQTQVVPLPK